MTLFGVTISVSNLIATGAGVVAVISLFVSFAAYRQRARYHPQAKLVLEWSKRIEPLSGLFFRDCVITNHGDGAARDLRVNVNTVPGVDGSPWRHSDALEPGEHRRYRVPVVANVIEEYQVGVLHFSHPGQAQYKFTTPVLTVSWRQPPFDSKPSKLTFRGPRTPNLLEGETS